MQIRRDPQGEGAGEILVGGRWRFDSITVEDRQVLINRLALVGVHRGLIGSVHSAEEQARASPDEALVVIAPIDDLLVVAGSRVVLAGDHSQ